MSSKRGRATYTRLLITSNPRTYKQPLLPNKMRGVPRIDDRKVTSGIIHVIRYGLMWRRAPVCCGPYKTLYNRFVR
jgi:transposase